MYFWLYMHTIIYTVKNSTNTYNINSASGSVSTVIVAHKETFKQNILFI